MDKFQCKYNTVTIGDKSITISEGRKEAFAAALAHFEDWKAYTEEIRNSINLSLATAEGNQDFRKKMDSIENNLLLVTERYLVYGFYTDTTLTLEVFEKGIVEYITDTVSLVGVSIKSTISEMITELF